LITSCLCVHCERCAPLYSFGAPHFLCLLFLYACSLLLLLLFLVSCFIAPSYSLARQLRSSFALLLALHLTALRIAALLLSSPSISKNYASLHIRLAPLAQWHAFRQRLQSTMQLTLGVAELQSHLLLASAVIVKCAVNLCYCCIALALLSAARERFSVQLASLRCARCAVPCYAMRCCCKERTAFTFTLSVHQAQFMHRPLFS